MKQLGYLLSTVLDNDEKSVLEILKSGEVTQEEFNYRDKGGRTCLSCAASLGNLSMVDLLEATGRIDVNAADHDGNTALINAASMGHVLTTMKLCRWSKLNINQQNYSGFTALMKAAMQGHHGCVEALTKSGADTELRDDIRNLTALQWAKYCGSSTCLKILKKYSSSQKLSKPLIMDCQKLNKSTPDLSQLCSVHHKKTAIQKIKSLLTQSRTKDLNENSLVVKDLIICTSTPAIPLLLANSETSENLRKTLENEGELTENLSQRVLKQLNLSPIPRRHPPAIEITTETGETIIPDKNMFKVCNTKLTLKSEHKVENRS